MVRIRVLHVLHRLDIGGAETVVINLCEQMDCEKYEFDFLVHGCGAYDERVIHDGFGICNIGKYINEEGPLLYRKRLVRFLKTNGAKYDIVHSHVDQTSGFILPLVRRYTSAVCIAHSHAVRNENGRLVDLYKRYLQKRLNETADVRVACSKAAGEWLFRGYPYEVVYNGIDKKKFVFSKADRISIRQRYGLSEDAFVIGQVGRFEPVKNHQFTIRLLADCRKKGVDAKLLFLGDGSIVAELRALAKELGVAEDVIFAGFCTDAYRFYSAMDLYVVPSAAEGFSLVAVEAQASSLPVIASEGVPREVGVTDQIRYLPLELSVWSEAAVDVLRRRPERETLPAFEEFGIENSAKCLETIYHHALEKHKR